MQVLFCRKGLTAALRARTMEATTERRRRHARARKHLLLHRPPGIQAALGQRRERPPLPQAAAAALRRRGRRLRRRHPPLHLRHGQRLRPVFFRRCALSAPAAPGGHDRGGHPLRRPGRPLAAGAARTLRLRPAPVRLSDARAGGLHPRVHDAPQPLHGRCLAHPHRGV